MQVCVYLLLVLHAADGCTLDHHSERGIVGYAGESVLLPCSCTNTHTRPERFIWEKHNTHTNTWDVISSESEQYRNRVQLGTAHSPGNLSLLISHLTEEDEGQYRCNIKENEYRYITLYVSVCKDVVNHLTVVSGYVGGFVLLPCYCTQLLTNPKTLRWSFTDESNIIYPTDQTNRYTGRIQLVTAPGNFSLFIRGLTKEDWGEYRCMISSDRVIQVKLKVTEGRNPTSVDTDNSCPTVSGKPTTTVTSLSPTTSQHGYNSSSPSTTTKGKICVTSVGQDVNVSRFGLSKQGNIPQTQLMGLSGRGHS
ncbi:V-set and immunoglobulin domain-containing protein 1-like [Brachyhypopomus gauderio]|uniref:V-set and immunoglobulin domain-containing protein 1-like n=1 Tax=Brachyhypopomus gauderio TaxID=698409 RepID=UPI0040421F13